MYATWGKYADASRLMFEGRYTEAEKDWNRALEIRQADYGADSPKYAEVPQDAGGAAALGRPPLVYSILLSYLGDFYMATRDWQNADEQYRTALELRQRVLGNNRAVAQSMVLLSKAL